MTPNPYDLAEVARVRERHARGEYNITPETSQSRTDIVALQDEVNNLKEALAKSTEQEHALRKEIDFQTARADHAQKLLMACGERVSRMESIAKKGNGNNGKH